MLLGMITVVAVLILSAQTRRGSCYQKRELRHRTPIGISEAAPLRAAENSAVLLRSTRALEVHTPVQVAAVCDGLLQGVEDVLA